MCRRLEKFAALDRLGRHSERSGVLGERFRPVLGKRGQRGKFVNGGKTDEKPSRKRFARISSARSVCRERNRL